MTLHPRSYSHFDALTLDSDSFVSIMLLWHIDLGSEMTRYRERIANTRKSLIAINKHVGRTGASLSEKPFHVKPALPSSPHIEDIHGVARSMGTEAILIATIM